MPRDTRKRYKQDALALAEATASLKPEISPNATLGPEASQESTSAKWMGSESTSAPTIGDEETDSDYASSGVELVDKFLQGRIKLTSKEVSLIITIVWFGFISFLFMKDNELNKLDDINGIGWFAAKAGLYSILYIIVGVIIGRTFNEKDSKGKENK